MTKKKRKAGWLFTTVLLFVIILTAFGLYKKFFVAKVQLKNKNYAFVFIKSNANLEEVITALNDEGIIDDQNSFKWLAEKMGLQQNINPGKYRITNGMTMRQIINLVKYGREEKTKLTYNSQIHNMDEFIAYTDEKLELSYADIESFTNDEKKLANNFNLDPDCNFALVLPGTYEVSWAINADDFFGLLKEKYKRVWSKDRCDRAKKIGFSIKDIIILASIVQSESSIRSEQEKIAGVYINRLKKSMPLQADPTLKFANGNYDAARILDADKQIDSPYNTYLNKGLPPGPICLVSSQAIDAVLNYVHHSYIFFCAKPQLNGYSDFSTTYDQHRKYANAYQKVLDQKGIKR